VRGGVQAGAVGVIVAVCAASAAAQTPLPPLPPIGGLPPGAPPPPGERPPPQEPPRPGPVSQAPGSVTENVDVAQSGHLPDDGLVPPLVRRWKVESRPVTVLAANGRVYSVERGGVVAFDQADGKVLWRATLAGGSEGSAFDDGRLFVSTFDDLHALNAETGALLWTRRLTEVAFSGAPVAGGGVAYVMHDQGGGTLHAFRASDGAELWKVSHRGGSDAPAIDNDRVYVAGACANAQAFNRSDGKTAWSRHTGCSGGGDVTPALHAGRLYVPDGDYENGKRFDPPILDAASGGLVGRFTGTRPLFVDGLGVFPNGDSVARAVELASGREVWQVKGAWPLIAVGHDVYAIQDMQVRAFDAETGRLLWSDKLKPDGSSDQGPRLLAAAPGLLLVAEGAGVSAYESALKPPPRGVALGAYYSDLLAGRRAILAGVLGTELRGDRPQATIESARWRGGDFKPVLSTRPGRDGGFGGRPAVVRNTRFRATAAGAASDALTVYAYPSVKLGRPVAVSRFGVRLSVVARAPATRLSGRTFVLYLDRHKTKGLTLLARARLRGGRRARAVLSFQDKTPFDKRDLVYFCIRGQLALDLGRPDPLTRRCGARRLPEPE
jgi:outer membrane protein assembly factor BamB